MSDFDDTYQDSVPMDSFAFEEISVIHALLMEAENMYGQYLEDICKNESDRDENAIPNTIKLIKIIKSCISKIDDEMAKKGVINW